MLSTWRDCWMDDCWTLFCLQIVARVVSAPERLSLSSNKSEQTGLEAALLTRLRGFSRIVDALIAVRIPIVGHNCLMDLLLIYQGNASDSQSNYLRKFFCGPVMYVDNSLINAAAIWYFNFGKREFSCPRSNLSPTSQSRMKRRRRRFTLHFRLSTIPSS